MSAKKLERNFTKPSQISRHLNCSICSEVFLEPIRLHCQHTFCKKCIEQWEKANNSCPVCRTEIEKNLKGRDLICEKIIQDAEVYCVNKMCEWKDRLENLEKHVKKCQFNKTPEWLTKAQNSMKIDEPQTMEDIYIQADENYIERVNEEVSRKTLLERLYTKDSVSKQLVDSVFNPNKNSDNKQKGGSKKKGRGGKKSGEGEAELEKKPTMDFYDSLFGVLDSDDEEQKDDQNEARTIDSASKKESVNDKQDVEELGKTLDFESTKASLEKENLSENKEDVVEVQCEELSVKERNKRRTRSSKNDTGVLKKAKTMKA